MYSILFFVAMGLVLAVGFYSCYLAMKGIPRCPHCGRRYIRWEGDHWRCRSAGCGREFQEPDYR